MMMPLQAYGTWLADSPRTWDAAVMRAAKHGLIDTLGVALRGTSEPVVRNTLAAVQPWGSGPARVIGHAAALPAPHAALVNGAAAHALDFDDNFDPAKAHASAVLIPTILAVADEVGASGADLIDAYAAPQPSARSVRRQRRRGSCGWMRRSAPMRLVSRVAARAASSASSGRWQSRCTRGWPRRPG
jgi:hypothetical protein